MKRFIMIAFMFMLIVALGGLGFYIGNEPGSFHKPLLAIKEVSAAEKGLKEGILHNPKSFRLRFLLSQVYMKLEQIDKATGILEESLTLEENPKNPQIIPLSSAKSRALIDFHSSMISSGLRG